MRRGLFTLGVSAAVAAMTACNLLSGASDLTTDGEGIEGGVIGDDGSTIDGASSLDGGSRDGAFPPLDGAVTDGAIVVPEGGSICVGAACFDAGSCPDGPTCPIRIIALGTGKIGAIAADNNGVYWTQPSTRQIGRLRNNATSGPDVLVTAADGTPNALAALSTELFWTESDSGRVRKISSSAPAGSVAAKTLAGQGAVTTIGIGAGGVAIAWANAAGTVTEAATDLSQPTLVGSNRAPVVGVGVYALQTYWASAGMLNEIRSGTGAPLATQTDLRALAVDTSRVYWVSGSGFVESVTQAGGAKLSLSGEGEPVAIAVDDGQMFWVNRTDGRVRTASVQVQAPRTLASGQGKPRAVAINATWVYWVNDIGGEVWALRR